MMSNYNQALREMEEGGVVAEALARFGARPDGVGDDEWASEVAIAMRECGCDANGTVNFNAFKRVYNHTKGLAEKDSRGARFLTHPIDPRP